MKSTFMAVLFGISILSVGCNSQSAQPVDRVGLNKSTEAVGRDGTKYNPQTDEELAYYEKPEPMNCPGCTRWKAVKIVPKPKTVDDKIVALFDLMKKPSNDGKGAATVPQKVDLLDTSLNNGVITLNFNDQVKNSLNDTHTRQTFVNLLNDTMILNFGSANYIKYQVNGVDTSLFNDAGGPVFKIR